MVVGETLDIQIFNHKNPRRNHTISYIDLVILEFFFIFFFECLHSLCNLSQSNEKFKCETYASTRLRGI